MFLRNPLIALGVSGLLAGIQLGCAPTVASPPQAPAATAPDALSLPSIVVTRIAARASRRASGDWVLFDLKPLDEAAPALTSSPVGGETEVHQLLSRYARAVENGDLGGLATVWAAEPSDLEGFHALYRRGVRMYVDLSGVVVAVDGDSAELEFDQWLMAGGANLGAGLEDRALRRALGARDALGGWPMEHLTRR